MAYGSVRYFPDHDPAFNYTSLYVAYYNGIHKFESSRYVDTVY